MDDVVVASDAADAVAVAAARQHHAELACGLRTRVAALRSAADEDPVSVAAARRALVTWCRRELVWHAVAEEAALYPAAAQQTGGALLVDGMLDEHRTITALVAEIGSVAEPRRAAEAAYALAVLFDAHLNKENDLVLPLLAGAPDVSVVGLLSGMHELLGETDDGSGEVAVLAQVEPCPSGALAVDYFEPGPEVWRPRFVRSTANSRGEW